MRPAPDLVARDFNPAAPNRLWVADLTEIPTWEGRLYLAVVIDCYSRRVVGWAMAEHKRERGEAHVDDDLFMPSAESIEHLGVEQVQPLARRCDLVFALVEFEERRSCPSCSV